jgi:pimeloyl-ACP methyl ester carboxylesterase
MEIRGSYVFPARRKTKMGMMIDNTPVILREGNYTARNLYQFRKRISVSKTVDVYNEQKREFFEISHLRQIEEGKRNDNHNKLLGNWIFFPWSGALLHAVNEQEYQLLRTNRNKNLITTQEQTKLESSVIAIAGLSVGSGIATTLAYQGIANTLKLAEFDSLETTNLNRMRATINDIGKPKLSIVSEQLYEINPYINLIPYPKGLTKANVREFVWNNPTPNVIFEIIDDFELKILLRLEARQAGIPVISLANLGDSILFDVERFDLNPKLTLFNGVLGNLPETILNNPNADKHAYAVAMVGRDNVPPRALSSVAQIGKTLVGRPQLGSTVTVSSGLGAFLARKILLNAPLPSGRFKTSFDDIIAKQEGTDHNDAAKIMKPKPNYEAWDLDYRSFPKHGSMQEKLKFFLRAGILAASIHNTQPWSFEIKGNEVAIIPDWTRQLPHTDPSAHHLFTSIGCAITNIEVAAAYWGFTVEIRLQSAASKKPFITLTFHPTKQKSSLNELCPSITKRYSNKSPYLLKPIPSDILATVSSLKVGQSEAWVTSDHASIMQAAILQEEAVIADATPVAFKNELAHWLRPNNSAGFDGMPGFVVGMTQPQSIVGKFMLPKVPFTGKILGGKDRHAITTSPTCGLLVSSGNDLMSYVELGRLYERVALTLTSYNISCTPMHSIAYYPKAQSFLQSAFDYHDKKPKFFFRAGYSGNTPYHSPRRSLEHVLTRINSEESLTQIVDTPTAIHQINIGKHTINYLTAGKGAPIILLHGGNIGWGQWYPNIAALAQHFTVYALDFPGGGRSSRIDFYTMNLQKDLVDIVIRFIQKKNLKKAHIIGSSIGGWAAMNVALKSPQSVNKLVLADAIGFSQYLGPMERMISIPRFARFMSQTMLKPDRSNKNVEMFMRSVFADINFPFSPEFIEYYFETMKTSHNLLFISRLSGLSGVPKELAMKDKLPGLMHDTLILWGDGDKLMPFVRAEPVIKRIPNCRVKIMHGAGHIPSIEKSEEFNHTVLEFLQS